MSLWIALLESTYNFWLLFFFIDKLEPNSVIKDATRSVYKNYMNRSKRRVEPRKYDPNSKYLSTTPTHFLFEDCNFLLLLMLLLIRWHSKTLHNANNYSLSHKKYAIIIAYLIKNNTMALKVYEDVIIFFKTILIIMHNINTTAL